MRNIEDKAMAAGTLGAMILALLISVMPARGQMDDTVIAAAKAKIDAARVIAIANLDPMGVRPSVAKDIAKSGRFTLTDRPPLDLVAIFTKDDTGRKVSYRDALGDNLTDPVYQVCVSIATSDVAGHGDDWQRYVIWQECRTPPPYEIEGPLPTSADTHYRLDAEYLFKDFLKYADNSPKKKHR